ncbi:MAG: YitT family protein [Bacteroidales bacterium]|nr:YitT family protein [Bacteroidales bacterium]
MKKESKTFAILRSHVIITFGLLCTTFGWGAFLIPSNVTGGGVSGIAAIVYFATGFPAGITYLLVNSLLILIAMKMVNVNFGLKSVYGVIVFSLLLGVFQEVFPDPLVKDTLLATIVGAILAGIGTGIVFTQGGSAGGTDLIAMMITSQRNISPGRVIMTVDVVIISSSFFIFHSLERMIYGYCVMVISSYVIDFVLAGSKQSYQLFIFSDKYEQVAEHIFVNVKRGLTLVDAQGWYTKKPTKMILVIVRKYEVTNVFRAIKEVDPEAFISMGNVMGVYGKGFDRMKVK